MEPSPLNPFPPPPTSSPLPAWGERRAAEAASSRQPFARIGFCHEFAAAVGALLDLDLALGQALRPDQNLPRNADEIGGSEFRARPLVEVVVEHIDAFGGEFAVKPLAGGVGVGAALLEIEKRDFEWGDRLRPFDAGIVVERFDDAADQTRDSDAVGPAVNWALDSIRARHDRLHRFGILGAEIENLPDLDAAGVQTLPGGDLALEAGVIVHVLGRGIEAGPRADKRRQICRNRRLRPGSADR